MIARAGALDQGNIIANLLDAQKRELSPYILFLAGSAINSIKNSQGQSDPGYGAQAMMQAIDVFYSGELTDVSMEQHVATLAKIAADRQLTPLRDALRQRYPNLDT